MQCAAALIPGLPCVAPDGTVTAEQATALLTGGLATFLPYQSTFQNRGDNSAFSLFADATWTPSEVLEITAGVRFLWEDRESFFSSVQPNSVISGAPLLPVVNTGGFEVSRADTFNAILPRFNILYRVTPELNLYGTISKGRRSPVVDVTAVGFRQASQNTIAAEKVWNYEGGLKYADRVCPPPSASFIRSMKIFRSSSRNTTSDSQRR